MHVLVAYGSKMGGTAGIAELMYTGHWHGQARRFVRRHTRRPAAGRPGDGAAVP